MKGIGHWLREELRAMLPIWAFFFFSLALLSFTLSLVLDNYHIEAYEAPEYLAGSLILAKAVMLVDAFKRERFRGRPLLYLTLWETCLYFAATLTLRFLEELIKTSHRTHLTLGPASRMILHDMTGLHQLALMVWLIVFIFVFCTARQLISLIGHDRFVAAFFGIRKRSPDLRKAS